MILDSIILLTGAFLALIVALFGTINFVIPQQIPDAINLFFSYMRIADVFFPMSDIMLAVLTIYTVMFFHYLVKLILHGYALLPWIGKHVELPDQKAIAMHKRFEKVKRGKGIHTR